MRKYIYMLFTVFLIGTLTAAHISYKKAAQYKELYIRATDNMKAYESIVEENREFKYTIGELQASKDSINKKLLAVVDSLKIKPKNVQYLQYNTEVIYKTDTIVVNDTIFKEHTNIDTIVGDEWYKMNLKLNYPSTIITTPEFKSEKYIIFNAKKEYDKTPSKIFFIRWFQKRHWVTDIKVVEKSPYVDTKEQRFINIVK